MHGFPLFLVLYNYCRVLRCLLLLSETERYERTERFLRNWCNAGMPGTTPFFEAYVLFIIFWILMVPIDPIILTACGPF